MISNQQIFNHAVKYCFDRIRNNKPWIFGWGSGSCPDARCIVGSMDVEIYTGSYYGHFWSKTFDVPLNYFDKNSLIRQLMTLNDRIALGVSPYCYKYKSIINEAYLDIVLQSIALEHALIYQGPNKKPEEQERDSRQQPIKEEEFA